MYDDGLLLLSRGFPLSAGLADPRPLFPKTRVRAVEVWRIPFVKMSCQALRGAVSIDAQALLGVLVA